MGMAKCPVCGVSVKAENLERHLKNRHPREEVDLEEVLTAPERQDLARTGPPRRPPVTRKGLGIVAVVAVLLAVVLIVATLNPFGGAGPDVGQEAPDFTLPTSTGGSITLSAYRGVPVFLEFMDIDCSFCVQEARDVLPSLYASYNARVRFLSVDINFLGGEDTAARINEFRDTYGTPWVYAMDSDSGVASRFGVSSTPTAFVLDAGGVVTEVLRGAQPASAYAEALDRALGI